MLACRMCQRGITRSHVDRWNTHRREARDICPAELRRHLPTAQLNKICESLKAGHRPRRVIQDVHVVPREQPSHMICGISSRAGEPMQVANTSEMPIASGRTLRTAASIAASTSSTKHRSRTSTSWPAASRAIAIDVPARPAPMRACHRPPLKRTCGSRKATISRRN